MKKASIAMSIVSVVVLGLFFAYKTIGYHIYQPGPDCYQDDAGVLRSLEDDEPVYVIDSQGEMIIKNDYDVVFMQNGGYYEYSFLGKHGVFNDSCEIVIEAKYDDIIINTELDKVSFVVVKNDKYSLYNEQGEKVSEFYDYISDRFNRAFDYIDTSSIALDNTYRGYVVDIDGKEGLINYQGQIVIPLMYEQIFNRSIQDETFLVEKDGLFGVVDKNNDVVLPIICEEIEDNICLVEATQQYIIINQTGFPITEDLFDEVIALDANTYKVRLLDEWFILDNEGNVIE